MKIFKDITELIGNTPLVELGLARELPGRVVLKLETFNPLSIKDRPAHAMIDGAERNGKLSPGGTLVEATSGNMGMALAMIGRRRGYRVVLCMSELMSVERRQLLAALGAEVVLTPAEHGTRGAREKAIELADSIEGAVYLGQHQNPDNPRAHEETTAEEIWKDTDGTVDAIVAGLGSGGTLVGAAHALKERKPALQLIGVEPAEAPMVSRGEYRPHRIMGTSPGFVSRIIEKDRDCLDRIELVSEADSFAQCAAAAREEGLLVGISCGAVITACLRLAAEPGFAGKLIVGMVADSAERYLSVDGFLGRP